MVKVLYFTQFYSPEPIAAAFRASDNARIWTKLNNSITVFTGYPNYPTGKIFSGYSVKLLTEETIDGVRVLRSKLVAKPNTSIVNRLKNALSFFFFGVVNILFNNKKIGENYDIVLGTSGVVFTALLGWLYAWIHKVPFVLEIRDITWIQMQATGRKASSLSVKLMKALELYLCNRASKIVTVTFGFKKILQEQGLDEKKIAVITNGVDVNVSADRTRSGNLIMSYFGTLGISQNIPDTLDYAEAICGKVQNFKYLIIGEGAEKTKLQNSIAENANSFAKMLPGMSAKELEPYYNQTQLSVIALRNSENFKYTIPSKLFQIMGRGIAVLFIGPNGETSSIVDNYCAGITLTGTKTENIEKLKKFFDNGNYIDVLRQMGTNGKKAVEQHYTRNRLAKEYVDMLCDVAGLKNEDY